MHIQAYHRMRMDHKIPKTNFKLKLGTSTWSWGQKNCVFEDHIRNHRQLNFKLNFGTSSWSSEIRLSPTFRNYDWIWSQVFVTLFTIAFLNTLFEAPSIVARCGMFNCAKIAERRFNCQIGPITKYLLLLCTARLCIVLVLYMMVCLTLQYTP